MKKDEMFRIWLGMVAFGCMWGFLEAITFGGTLHRYWGILFPYHLCPCFLMAAVFGSFVMGSALGIYKKPAMLIGIGLVAASFCWLGVPFLPASVRSSHYAPIVASATAAITGSFSLALVTGFFLKRQERSIPTYIGIGALSALLASILFILFTAYGVDKAICADLGYACPLPDFLGIGGMAWMVAQAIIFPLGYKVGERQYSWFVTGLERKPSLSYAGLAMIIALCFGGGTMAFMIGL